MLDHHDREKFAAVYRLLAEVLEHETPAGQASGRVSYLLGDLAGRVFMGPPIEPPDEVLEATVEVLRAAAPPNASIWRPASAPTPNSSNAATTTTPRKRRAGRPEQVRAVPALPTARKHREFLPELRRTCSGLLVDAPAPRSTSTSRSMSLSSL